MLLLALTLQAQWPYQTNTLHARFYRKDLLLILPKMGLALAAGPGYNAFASKVQPKVYEYDGSSQAPGKR